MHYSKLTYALIGCGRIAKNHIEAALKQENLQIAAVCDIVPERMDEMIALMPENMRQNVRKFEDYKAMLEELSLDIAAVATESGNHASIALDCIDKKVNVIIEKPIALSIADADKIISAAKEQGVAITCSHQNRFNLSVQKLHSAIKAGRFGRIFHIAAHIRWNRGDSYYAGAKWRGTWGQDGGCLMNQCIHNLDLLRWIMGSEIDEVFAYTENFAHPYIEAEDTGLAVVKFRGGGLGLIEGTVNVYPKNLEETLYVFGERGTVKLGGTSVNRIDEWSFADGIDTLEMVKDEFSENPPNVYGFGHTPLYADFIDAINKNKEPYIPVIEGKKSMEMILAIYKSSATGKPVKLPLDECATTDFTGMFGENHEA